MSRGVKAPFVIALLIVCLRPVGLAHAEICHYVGQTDYKGSVSIETRSEGSRFRTLLRFTAQTLLGSVNYDLDESDQLESGRLRSVAFNECYQFNKKISHQLWDFYTFNWDQRQTQAARIQGKKPQDFERRYPLFARHWESTAFGDDWQDDFEASHAETRPDLELKGFSDNVMSGFYMAFDAIRWVGAQVQTFEPFLPESKTGVPAAQVRLEPSQSGQETVWKVPLSMGALKTPATEPALFTVDQGTRRLVGAHLVIVHDFGKAEGEIKLVSCQ